MLTFCTVWIHCFWITQHTSEKHIMNCIKSMRQYLWKYRQRYSRKYGADTVRLFALWVITEGLDVLLRPSFSRYAGIRDWLCRSSLRTHMGNPAGIWIGERERENRFHLQDYWSHWDAACMKHKVSFSSPLQRQENEKRMAVRELFSCRGTIRKLWSLLTSGEVAVLSALDGNCVHSRGS